MQRICIKMVLDIGHGRGPIEGGEVLAGPREIGYRGLLAFDDWRGENPGQWVQAVGRFPTAFVERYGDD